MQGTPDQAKRDPIWLWPVVGAAGLIVLGILLAISLANPAVVTPPGGQGTIVWLGTLATLFLYSLIYRENPYYRFAEHVFLGLAAGYGVYQIWATNLFQNWYQPLFIEGKWLWSIALVIGMMYFTVYNRRLAWMSRIVIVMILAFDAGNYFRLFAGDWMGQIGDSFRPLVMSEWPFIRFSDIVFVGTLLAVMIYFLFSFEQRNRAVRGTATTGRWLMMVAFGAMFGSTVMARMSLFIGRLSHLFQDWIHLIPKQ